MTRRADPPGEVIHIAGAFLAIRRFGLLFTETIEAQFGPEYRDNGALACLAVIGECGPLRLRDLTEIVELGGPTASRVVDRLVATGDVVRRSGSVDGDRRAVEMEATRAGVRRLDEIDRALRLDADRVGVSVKDALAHFDRLPDAEPVTERRRLDSITGRLARFGLVCGAALGSLTPTGDVAEAMALFALAEDGESRPRIIADRVGLTSGGTTKLLDRLEDQGYIERTFGLSDDRRGVAVALTQPGREQLLEMSRLAVQFVPDVHASLVDLAARLDRSS